MGFAELLRELMVERGLKSAEVAHRVPCDKAYKSRIANGRQHPSRQITCRLDELLAADGALIAAAEFGASTGNAVSLTVIPAHARLPLPLVMAIMPDRDLRAEYERVLGTVCERIGAPVTDAELVNLHSNAIYALRSAGLIVRIATNRAALDRVTVSLRVTEWLAANGFPCTMPARVDGQSPPPFVNMGFSACMIAVSYLGGRAGRSMGVGG